MRLLAMLVVFALLLGAGCSGPDVDTGDGYFNGPDRASFTGKTVAVMILPIAGVKTMGWNNEEFFQIYNGFSQRTDADILVISPEDGVVGPRDANGENIAVEYLYELDPALVDALVIIGGQGPSFWRDDNDLHTWVRELAALDRPLGGVCGGVKILAAAGLLEGRQVATNSQYESVIENHGGIYVGEGLKQDGLFWSFSYGYESQFLDDFLPGFQN